MGVRGHGQAAIVGLVVALAAAALSFGRLLLQSGNAVGELLWAEDGLFPLCIRKAGLWECLSDPFAGYLLALPRLLAGITAMSPIESWGWTSNIVAAIAWGSLAGIATFWLIAAGVRMFPAVVVAILPIIVPITGLEAVNAIGSVYMPLLFTSTLALALGWTGRTQTVIASGLALLAAVTIPTALLLIGVLGFSVVRGRVTQRSAMVVFIATVLGGVLQFAAVLSAPVRRNTAFSFEALTFWLNDLPVAMLTTWPGLSFGPSTVFGIFTLPTVSWTGALFAVGLVALGVFLALNKSPVRSVAGLLIIAGLAYSFVPTVTGYASNRYFVLTVTSVVGAAVLVLDQTCTVGKRWRFYAVVAIVAAAWVTAFPASAWRAVPAPPWHEVLERASAQCQTDPMAPVCLTFSPDWPQEGVTELKPPTNEFAPCSVLHLSTNG